MRRSIRAQLLVPLMLLVIGTVGVSAWLAWTTAHRARSDLQDRVEGVSRTLSAPHFPLTHPILERIKALTGSEFALDLTGGRSIATIDLASESAHSAIEAHRQVDGWYGPTTRLAGRDFVVESIPLPSGHPNGEGTLFVLFPKERFDAEIRSAVTPSLAFALGGGVVAIGMMIAVGRGIIRRLRELNRQTRRIADGDFRPMATTPHNDEIRDLVDGVNEMVDRLQQSREQLVRYERLRLLDQVSAGWAHQLRNGVAGAKLAIQLHAQECHEADRESLDVAQRQLLRLETDIARFLEFGRTARTRQRVDIMGQIRRVTDLTRHRCRHAGIEFVVHPCRETPFVEGDPVSIEHLLLNLLNNAMDAAGPGGLVEVAVLHPQAEICIVEVRDSGDGPPDSVAGRVFEPFVTGKPDGVGLGLFVAQQLAESHGGRLQWRRDGNTTVFRCEMPACTGSGSITPNSSTDPPVREMPCENPS